MRSEKLSDENSLLLCQEREMIWFKKQFLINVISRFCLQYLGCKHHRQMPAKRKAFSVEYKKVSGAVLFNKKYFLVMFFLTSKMWARYKL